MKCDKCNEKAIVKLGHAGVTLYYCMKHDKEETDRLFKKGAKIEVRRKQQ